MKFIDLQTEGRYKDNIEWYFKNKEFHPILLAKTKKELQKAIDDYYLQGHGSDLKPLLKLLKIKEVKQSMKFLPLLFEGNKKVKF